MSTLHKDQAATGDQAERWGRATDLMAEVADLFAGLPSRPAFDVTEIATRTDRLDGGDRMAITLLDGQGRELCSIVGGSKELRSWFASQIEEISAVAR